VKSVLKSATGLQARKLAELNIPAFATPDDAAAVYALRPSGGGFKANLRSLLRAGQPGKGSRALAAAAAMRAAGGGRAELRMLGSAGGALEGVEEGGEEGYGGGGEGGLGVEGVLETGSADYVELMRDAMRQKQRQQKAALLLGPVPPLPGALGGMGGAAAVGSSGGGAGGGVFSLGHGGGGGGGSGKGGLQGAGGRFAAGVVRLSGGLRHSYDGGAAGGSMDG